MKIKRNKKSYKWFLCGLIMVVVLTISYRVSKANYRISNIIELTTGKIVSSPYDFNIVSMYIDGVEQEKDTVIPDNGYTIDEEKSYCYKDSKSNKDNTAKLYTDEFGNYIFKDISKGSKCILYFKKVKTSLNSNCGVACKYILSKIDGVTVSNNTVTGIKTRRREYNAFSISFEDTNNYIYEAPDDDGASYYFAGNPTNNWVEFGGYYWRIIRINGNGSIRMIYQGRAYDENSKKLEPQTTGEETQIGISAFNTNYNDNMYVGYFYTPNQQRGLGISSTIYEVVNTWFKKSALKTDTNNYNKLDLNEGFCGDRSAYLNNNGIILGEGIGLTSNYYGAHTRIVINFTPQFSCPDDKDLYTYSGANKGNKVLENSVGLITADEVLALGIGFGSSKRALRNYLYTGNDYWTISPSACYGDYARVFFVGGSGWMSHNQNEYTFGVGASNIGIRPVINLRADVLFTGTGTQSNPYKVVI